MYSFISYSRLCECFKGVNSLVIIFIDRQSLISYLAPSDVRLTEGFLTGLGVEDSFS